MKKFLRHSVGMTFIELLVGLTIVSVIIGGILSTFQGFVRYNSWVTQYSALQRTAFQEIQQIQRAFFDEMVFFPQNTGYEELSLGFKKSLAQKKKNLEFVYLSAVSERTAGISLPQLSQSSGFTAFHEGVFSGGMVISSDALFFVDTGSHTIWKIDLVSNTATLYAGVRAEAGALDHTNALQAKFRNPTGLTLYDGKLYIADTGNHAIRSIVLDDNPDNRFVETVAGVLGVSGNSEGLAETSLLSFPQALTFNESNGEMFIADTGNHSIKKISGGVMMHFMGTGKAGKSSFAETISSFESSPLDTPLHILYDDTFHFLYINDYKNQRILRCNTLNPKIEKVSPKEVFYGGIQIFDDGGVRYIEFQEESGKIYSFHTLDKTISLVFNPSVYTILGNEYTLTQYTENNFLRYHNDFLVFGYPKNEFQNILLRMSGTHFTGDILAGQGGGLLETTVFDPDAFVFSLSHDMILFTPVKSLYIREFPSYSLQEVIVEYEKEYALETLLLKHSFVLGKSYSLSL
jgi:type II secretory pathway pseudopilin PulG